MAAVSSASAKAELLFSIEEECLTAVDGTDGRPTISDEIEDWELLGEMGHFLVDPRTPAAATRFVEILAKIAPSLPAADRGIFTPYGRIYIDHGLHVELAAAECACPYGLVSLRERQHALVRRAVALLREEGTALLLANTNHSELLQSGQSTWGCHENYLVEVPPGEIGARILPFLISRVYAGAGGVHLSGKFLAAVRPQFMEFAEGGNTTRDRAIHSTCRNESHQGPDATRFRYHLIVGDGHRSHFNLALQIGATALALKAIVYDEELQASLRHFSSPPLKGCWVKSMQELHVLARPGERPRVHPLALEIQRLYLAGAKRYAASLDGAPPSWVSRLFADWEATLDAMERQDLAWLAARLDAFTKYALYTSVLADAERTWSDVVRNEERLAELALLDQSYHEFPARDSVFARLERRGLLEHRVGESIEPGEEREAYVPETGTRASARARFIRENEGDRGLLMDWSWVRDGRQNQHRTLFDPFARAYGPWRRCPA